MDAQHVGPLGVLEVEDHVRTTNAGVVHDDVDAPPGVEGGLDERLAAVGGRDVVDVGDRLPAGVPDLGDGLVGRRLAGLGTVGRDADVVHDDARAVGGKPRGLGPADAAPGARHDRNPAVEHALGHFFCPLRDRFPIRAR
jgi:hypothetical protein